MLKKDICWYLTNRNICYSLKNNTILLYKGTIYIWELGGSSNTYLVWTLHKKELKVIIPVYRMKRGLRRTLFIVTIVHCLNWLSSSGEPLSIQVVYCFELSRAEEDAILSYEDLTIARDVCSIASKFLDLDVVRIITRLYFQCLYCENEERFNFTELLGKTL